MKNTITVSFDGEMLNIDDNNVDWFAFGCAVGLMSAEDETGEYRHNLQEFIEGIRGAMDYHARSTGDTSVIIRVDKKI